MFRLVFCLVACGLWLISAYVQGAEVNLYSARKEALIKPVLETFSQHTGIRVNLVTGKADALLSRLGAEGKYSKADLLLTTDVGRLVRARQQNLTQSVQSAVLARYVPADFRDKDGHWYGLTMRARPIMYAPERVTAGELSTLGALTGPQWAKRICIRSSSNIYNQSMVAAMIELEGADKTARWASQFVNNFARPPKGGDRDQIKAVAAGLCDIAIANTYYLAGMLSDADSASRQAAAKVKVFWPDQQGIGTHVNISGAALTRHSPNVDAAKALLEYLLSEEAQSWYASANHEYPIRQGIDWSDSLKQFGQFKPQQIDLERVGELNSQALLLMDKAGWK